MDKNECEDKYSETETEEHLNGKRDLFEWIKKQPCVTDAILEGWIPETKQRPDIMFKFNGKQYVIEYQCSPIASEYIERHELYQAAGINDIWILGTEKYLKSNMREKFIQSKSIGFYDSGNNYLIPINFRSSNIDKLLTAKSTLRKRKYGYANELFYGLCLNTFLFNGEIINRHIGDINDAIKVHNIRQEIKSKTQKSRSRTYREKAQTIVDKAILSLRLSTLATYPYGLDYRLSINNLKSTDSFKNIFLYANDLIRIEDLNLFLKKQENSNWVFTIDIYRKKKEYHLRAEPTIAYFYHDIFKKKVLNSYDLLNYCNDKRCLINDLESIMRENIKLALSHTDNNIRILEVQ